MRKGELKSTKKGRGLEEGSNDDKAHDESDESFDIDEFIPDSLTSSNNDDDYEAHSNLKDDLID